MMNLNITLNGDNYASRLENNRKKRLSRYIFSYVVEREGWLMAENIVENFLNSKNVNFHDPKFPFVDLIVKTDTKLGKKDDLLNVKSSRKNTLRAAILSSLRGKNPKQKFLVSQINYILRSTNTKRAGDVMIGSKIVKSLKIKSFKDFKKNLKVRILCEYNRAHNADIKSFNAIPTLNEKVSMCFIYNPVHNYTFDKLDCSLRFEKTDGKTFGDLFDRTLDKCFDKTYNVADLVFYVFDEHEKFNKRFLMETTLDDNDVKKIRKIYGLNGSMSNLKNDVINQVRDMGNVKKLKQLKKEIATVFL